MTDELYKKHRPTLFKHVIGNDSVRNQLRGFVTNNTVPHAILFSGPSGCGKTTLARILAKAIKVKGTDLQEINCASKRGIDLARDLQRQCNMAPMVSPCRVWIIDEAQGLTPDAQDALLKTLEDTPRTAYFFLCSTHPQKLKPTILTRCTPFTVKPLTVKEMETLLSQVATAESITLTEEIIEAIVEAADGSPRKALVLLGSIAALDDDAAKLAAIQSPTIQQDAINLARALIDTRKKWGEVSAILKAIDRSEPESIRHLVLSYATTILLSNAKMAPTAALVLTSFRDHFYDCKKGGLELACWEVAGHRK